MIRSKAEIRAACEAEQRRLIAIVGLASWWDGATNVLTAEERRAVSEWWDRMPGSSCWNDAFLSWMRDG